MMAYAMAGAADPGTAVVASGLDGNGHFLKTALPGNAGFAYARLVNGVQVKVDGVYKNLIFHAPDTVRVNATLGENHWTAPSLVVVEEPSATPLEISETDTALSIASSELRLQVDKTTGAVAFYGIDGTLYTEERPDAPQSLTPVTLSGAPSYEAENTFRLRADEAIFGFGFTADDQVNRRGKDLLLVQTNVGIIIPVMMSSRRYGVLWDTYSQMRFRDGEEGASLWAESAPGGVDYYFMAGQTPDEVIGAYRRLTGHAPMYPKQAFGLFMSKERYPTQARLLEVAETFRRERFPLDYIVQDWQYWGSDKDGTWSGMIWDPERFPDPAGMAAKIHAMNLKLMVSIWPSVGNDTALARELDAQGLRFAPLHWISRQARVYDAYSPAGREIYFRHIKSGLLDKGVDALWMDGTEVEVSSAMWDPLDNIRDTKALGSNALGDFTRYLNPYTLLTTQGTYEGQRATSDKRVFTLTRSGWAGAQRTAAASWSGDIFASWKTFREQVAGGVNVTVTGAPYWTQDTGGFFVMEFPGGENNPAWQELYARWMQYSAFNPIMRIHGTSVEREPYLFKERAPDIHAALLGAVELRYRLLPYIYGLAWRVTSEDYTLMRPLMMDFPDDRALDSVDDAFMFGPSLLVHPVTRAMYHIAPPAPAIIPAQYLRTPDGQPGLAVEYFSGAGFETPRSRSVDLVVDHPWPDPPLAELPAGLEKLSQFSARWTGSLVAPEDGEFEIGLEGDDGYRLFLDGEKVVDNWNFGPPRYTGTVRALKKGQAVQVTIEYFQGDGNRSLKLSWRSPSERKALAAQREDAKLDLSVGTRLPAGADWFDFWSQERFAGGTDVVRDAPLDLVPLYVRAGSILPMGPVMQYATEMPAAPYEVRVYPGADARFTIYEDDNETYAYERGERATYELAWDDGNRTLDVGARSGAFPGMVASRRLDFVLVDGSGTPQRKSVTYTGEPLSVSFAR